MSPLTLYTQPKHPPSQLNMAESMVTTSTAHCNEWTYGPLTYGSLTDFWSALIKKWSLQVFFLGGGYCFFVRREEGNLGRMRDGETTWWRITHRWLSSPPAPLPPPHTHARSSDQIKLKADGAGPGLRIVSDCHGALVVISHLECLPGQKKGMRKRQSGSE